MDEWIEALTLGFEWRAAEQAETGRPFREQIHAINQTWRRWPGARRRRKNKKR